MRSQFLGDVKRCSRLIVFGEFRHINDQDKTGLARTLEFSAACANMIRALATPTLQLHILNLQHWPLNKPRPEQLSLNSLNPVKAQRAKAEIQLGLLIGNLIQITILGKPYYSVYVHIMVT